MVRKTCTPEQIVNKLREAEVLISQGVTIIEASRKIGVTEQTYYRWRKEYGGMKVERLIRTIKEEEIYLHDYRDPSDAQSLLDLFRQDYNCVRPHQALQYRVPYEVYTGRTIWPTSVLQKTAP